MATTRRATLALRTARLDRMYRLFDALRAMPGEREAGDEPFRTAQSALSDLKEAAQSRLAPGDFDSRLKAVDQTITAAKDEVTALAGDRGVAAGTILKRIAKAARLDDLPSLSEVDELTN